VRAFVTFLKAIIPIKLTTKKCPKKLNKIKNKNKISVKSIKIIIFK